MFMGVSLHESRDQDCNRGDVNLDISPRDESVETSRCLSAAGAA
jgi:hypothetical protein